MEDSAKQTKKQPQRDRVTLDPVSISRLRELLEQIEKQFKGMKINRSDLVNYLIRSHSSLLSTSELQELKEQYFDEVEFAELALRELKQARARGETTSLQEVMKELNFSLKISAPRKRKTAATSEHQEKLETKISVKE